MSIYLYRLLTVLGQQQCYGIKPTATNKNGWELWLDATLKVPYLKRKLLEKIYNFVNILK